MLTWCGKSCWPSRGRREAAHTVERAVAPLRRELGAEAPATVRFETPPGRQMQVDFGEKRIVIGGGTVRALSEPRAPLQSGVTT
jgi:hypothetical protein